MIEPFSLGIWGWFSDLGTVQMALGKNRSTINNWLVVTGCHDWIMTFQKQLGMEWNNHPN